MKLLVIGKGGQLSTELERLSASMSHEAVFAGLPDFDMTREGAVKQLITQVNPDYVINAAAYTAVDKAEEQKELAYAINAKAAGDVASACKKMNSGLVHISTDYVFDGSNHRPYVEGDTVNPTGVYGASKLEGERLVLENLSEAVILRTSWVYSDFGNNFVKTMLKLCRERDSLNVIYDQVGTPTWAKDLAQAALTVIEKKQNEVKASGIFHFSNEGVCSWYDFAKAIFELKNISVEVKPIMTSEYPTAAERPHYSVLNKKKFKDAFGVDIPYYRDSLKECLSLID